MCVCVSVTPGSPVSTVGGAEGVVDVDIAQFGQRRTEGVDLGLSRFGLRAAEV